MNRQLNGRTSAVAAAVLVLGGVLGACSNSTTSPEPQSPRAAQATPSGEPGLSMDVYSRGTQLTNDLSQPPKPGQGTLAGADLFLLGGSSDHPAPEGPAIGSRFGVCTVVTDSQALCDGMIDLDGRGTISVQLEVLIPGGNQGIAITGGTGEFAGAAGTVTESMVPGHPDDRVLEIRITGYVGA